MYIFLKVSKRKKTDTETIISTQSHENLNITEKEIESIESENALDRNEKEPVDILKPDRPTPAQDSARAKIDALQSEIDALLRVKNTGILSVEHDKNIEKLPKDLEAEKKNTRFNSAKKIS